ncbi:RNA recognition motif domain-containing protein [Terrimonas rubra]|jgi:RNA recognition motif-containing protein|uniref:RNA recognition motif domain-containing protein n=1 Tax=Terrimonas rubra TaxID=1035890 RepID=A0ABW6A1M2_9BACT
MNMYVSNLSFNTSENDLQQLFSEYGTVSSLKIITDRQTGQSRGFAFVEMDIDDEANHAIENLNNKEVQGRQISVSVAREKAKRDPRNNW